MACTRIPTQLNFITGNKNKLAEVQAILSGVIELRNQNVDLVEIQGTVEEVTKDKARRAAEAVSRNSTGGNYLQKPLIRKMIDTRPRSSRRHMSVLQSHERPPRTLHVCSLPPSYLAHASNTPPPVNGSCFPSARPTCTRCSQASTTNPPKPSAHSVTAKDQATKQSYSKDVRMEN
jgi:hypothetical protein